jgi:NhaP-type Na+/H+ or K+/H+ antiporter
LLEITLSLVTPYLTYVLAEGAHLSGVLATVTAGIYVGSHLSAILAPAARLQAFAFLDVLVFSLTSYCSLWSAWNFGARCTGCRA